MGRYRTFETEKDEKSFEARIWWVFWVIALVVLCYTAYQQLLEYDLIHNGSSIEAEYYVYNGKELARYRDEQNVNYSFDLSDYDAVHGEDTVTLYYKDRINYAVPRRDIKSWLYSYFIFVPVLVVSSLIIIKIYRRKST